MPLTVLIKSRVVCKELARSKKICTKASMLLESQDPPTEVYRNLGMPSTPASHAEGVERLVRDECSQLRSRGEILVQVVRAHTFHNCNDFLYA